ncbi:hypothetical protein LWI28_003633 [Acer negundo]|uniref:Legumain prodomain domain-containing protein n=1 Tax=Acer negundo TaxID=4023 RepID=A0AAD5ICT4_ACENE|nr:hypothetical protein LWI28_003633 [Acer negundo]
MCWAACETYWYALQDITCFLWHKIKNTKRRNRRRIRDVESGYSSSDGSYFSDKYGHLSPSRKRYRERKRWYGNGNGNSSHHHHRHRHHHHHHHVRGGPIRLNNSRRLQLVKADVCHAYQILKKGGLKDENIIVFMYDDVAFAKENPMPGIIINKAYGPDVYYGVPKVKRRTGFDTPRLRSHVMQYGDKSLSNQLLYTYLGTNPENKNRTISDQSLSLTEKIRAVNQRDVELVYLRRKFENAPEGSQQKIEAEKKLNKEISQRKYVDGSINLIATSLFGQKDGLHLLEYVRPAGQPLVDDWDCLKMFVKIYEEKCGVLTTYGKKYARPMANMCNFGINEEQMIVASTKACSN